MIADSSEELQPPLVADAATPPVASPSVTWLRAIPAWAWGLLLLALTFNLAIHLRLWSFPLERDEGEFAYTAVRLLHGDLPYATVYNKKLPGVAYAYALSMLLAGETPAAVKLAGTAADLVSIALLFLLAVRLFSPLAGAIAALVYAVMALAPGILGNAAHATHFVNGFVLAGLLTLLAARERRRAWLFATSGLLFGLAVMMKQHAVFLAGFIGLWLLLAHARRRQSLRHPLLFAGSLATPFAALALVLLAAGLLPTLWLWSFRYAASYGTGLPLAHLVLRFWDKFGDAVDGFLALWLLSATGLGLLLFASAVARPTKVVLGLYLAGVSLSVLPGGLFRAHYFVTLLPLVALGSAYALERLLGFLGSRARVPHPAPLVLGALAALLMVALLPNWRYFFVDDPGKLCRQIYHVNPFPESPGIGRFIKSRTTAADTIAVLGSEAQLYFYSQRRAATGFIYVYGLMDGNSYSSEMQRQMMREIEEHRPKIIVVSNFYTSWLPTATADNTILDWVHRYVNAGFRMIALVDVSERETISKYFDEIPAYRPQKQQDTLYVFERVR